VSENKKIRRKKENQNMRENKKRSVVVLIVMQKLGIEPRFSRPQRDVLTTGRFLPDEPKHRADFDETPVEK
jgi:hypothetical protein